MTKQQPPPDTILALHIYLKQFIKNKTNHRSNNEPFSHRLLIELSNSSKTIYITDRYTNFVLVYINYSTNEYSICIYHQSQAKDNFAFAPLTRIEWTDPQLIDKLERAILEYHERTTTRHNTSITPPPKTNHKKPSKQPVRN